MAVERPQRDAGVCRDLLRRRILDTLGQESHQRCLAQRFAGALAAHRLSGPDHGSKLPQTLRRRFRTSYVNIDKTLGQG